MNRNPLPARGTEEFRARLNAEGLVVADRERNFYDDSDFYIVYFDPSKGTFEEYEYGTTRFAAPRSWGSFETAPEVARLYELNSLILRKWSAAIARNKRLEEIKRGSEVVISPRIRKHASRRGALGRVFWIGASDFGTRVGVEFADGERLFFAEKMVKAVPEKAPRNLNRYVARLEKAAGLSKVYIPGSIARGLIYA